MSSVSLNKVLRKNKQAKVFLEHLCHALGQDISIFDSNEKKLIGKLGEKSKVKPIYFEGQEIGKISGGKDTGMIESFLHLMVTKENEKKKLSSEVLGLYREINLIYNFTQKLAEKITPAEIAELTLEESRTFLKANSGLVYLFSESNGLTSKFGLSDLEIEELKTNQSFISKIINKKKADIFNHSYKEDKSVIFTPLAVADHHIGCIILIADRSTFTAADLKLLSTLAKQAAVAIETALLYEKNIQEVKQREAAIRALNKITSKFVPSEFIKSLGYEKITQVALGDSVEKRVTVLFSDIRGYTSLSENMTPEETFQFVNSFNNRMGPIILRNRGFINQYLGDGIMAIFPFKAYDALLAAIEMQAELDQYNEERLKKDRQKIRIGIGLHTGPLIMGITGDQQRLDATTISDTVNTASRIESLTKQYGVNILISESTLEDIDLEFIKKQEVDIRYLGRAKVKGKQHAIKIFECFNNDSLEIKKLKKATISTFNQAIQEWQDKEYDRAIDKLNEILAHNPNDKTIDRLKQKIQESEVSENSSNWSH
ncbi:MAG: adenylate/guanylate cyclase domain-containing protein [Bacteroidota bacterium]